VLRGAYRELAGSNYDRQVSYALTQYNFFNTYFLITVDKQLFGVRVFHGLAETVIIVCPRLKRVLLSGKAVLQAYGCVVLSA
jgi:hypothetical protein